MPRVRNVAQGARLHRASVRKTLPDASARAAMLSLSTGSASARSAGAGLNAICTMCANTPHPLAPAAPKSFCHRLPMPLRGCAIRLFLLAHVCIHLYAVMRRYQAGCGLMGRIVG
eukprot:scaffold5021_cov123-Isochrysis_galbana.AAC.13